VQLPSVLLENSASFARIGNVDAIGVQLPATCWAKAPKAPKVTTPNPWIKGEVAKVALGSAAVQWGKRLADSVMGFASVNVGGPLFIAPGAGSLRGT